MENPHSLGLYQPGELPLNNVAAVEAVETEEGSGLDTPADAVARKVSGVCWPEHGQPRNEEEQRARLQAVDCPHYVSSIAVALLILDRRSVSWFSPLENVCQVLREMREHLNIAIIVSSCPIL